MGHSRIREDVVWEACDTIFTREHPGAPGARNLQITRVLAIPVAEGVVGRIAKARGGSRFGRPEATKRRKSRHFGVFANLMIFGAPLSVSDTLQCVSQTRPQWGPVGIFVVGVSSRGVVIQNASCTRMGRARGGLLNGYASAAGPSFEDSQAWGLEGLKIWGPGHSRIRIWGIGDMKTWGLKDVQI